MGARPGRADVTVTAMRAILLGARGRAVRLACAVLLAASLSAITAAPAHAISSRTLFTPTGAAAGDNLGGAVAAAGDVNGDGYADVIVGAGYNDAGGTSAGQVYIYFGGPGADATPDWVLTGAAAGDYFGLSVGGAGDVNGDGYDDVIVGAYGNDAGGSDAGRAYVFYGGPAPDAIADLILTGNSAGEEFGYSVGTAGDVNGDGYADVIVGAPYNDQTGVNAGRACVYYGGPGADATADLTLTGAAAGDYFGWSVATAGDFNGDGYADVIVGAFGNDTGGANAGQAYVYYGGPGADATADLTLTGAAATDYFGYSVGTAGDVNGDGYADVIVGADLNDGGGADAGRAYVFYGGYPADATADLTLTGAAAGDHFGCSVGTAGDVNGDGYADVIVGAVDNDAGGTNAGRAYVYFGGTSPDATADVMLTGGPNDDEFARYVGTAGDVNRDGHDDVIVGAILNDAGGADAGRAYVTSIYPYEVLSPNGGETWVAGQPATVRWLGHDPADLAISFSGGASYSTLAVGVGGAEENEFTLVVPTSTTDGALVRLTYTGQTAKRSTSDASDAVFRIVELTPPPAVAQRLALTPTGAAAGDRFGYSVGPAGDVNGDGYADFIVGAPYNDAGGTDAGRAYLYLGGPSFDGTPDLTLTGAAAGDQFGWKVGTAGDMNSDGYADFFVTAPYNDAGLTDNGRIYVYYGGPSPDAVADVNSIGNTAGENFGISAGAAGDVNHDGYDDFVVGAPYSDAAGTDAGRVYVILGSPNRDALPDLMINGAAAGDYFGYAVGTAGDVNGDGYADLLVGAFGNDAGGSGAGRAYVYFGGATLNATADLVMTGSGPGDNLGGAVSAAGDLNGDGFGDFVIGAAGLGAGRAQVYLGGRAPDAVPDLVLSGTASVDDFGYAVGAAGDVNGDGYADLIVGADANDAAGTDAGRAYVYFGGAPLDGDADLVLTGAAAGDGFGVSVAGVGDVGGDGFADIIVGASRNDSRGTDAGRAYVYDCNRYFVLAPNDGEVWNVGGTATVSWLGAEPADLWLSADGGAAWTLLKSGVGGLAVNAAAVQVPHLPTHFARVKVAPSDRTVSGDDRSDSLFTIQSSVALLAFTATLGDGGAELAWSTDPGVGPGGLAGYRVYRVAAGTGGNGVRIGPDLIRDTRYTDAGGTRGAGYRLVAVNGLMEELELGRVSLAPTAPLAAWPLPYQGGTLNVSFAVYGELGAASGEAHIGIYDLSGRLVRTLADGPQAAGHRTLAWDGTDANGRPVRGGIYFLQARSAGLTHQVKVVVLR